ncbi:hypothetical protein [Phytoactinopolyspora limicola]|uniref:hypothetical protein n=1 Tax=Phytoactinopolyspora limicola TaxID=2715536 RepID=UPI00140746A3|nr:hypothetical protein [Phytoactinopolyspora limicola]
MDTSTRHGRRPFVVAILTCLAGLLVGFAIGVPVGRGGADTSLPDPCTRALTAADAVATAVEEEWATASAAVDAAQQELAASNFRAHLTTCFDLQ